MNEHERVYTIEELADLTGVTVRTIRFYIAEGIIPGPGARGKNAAYGEEHLVRLRLVRRLAEQRVPLAAIRERLAQLSVDEARAVLEEDARREVRIEQAAHAPSPAVYLSELLDRARTHRSPAALREPAAPPFQRSAPAGPPPAPPAAAAPAAGVQTWARHELAPGVELHVRADAREAQAELIARILRLVRRRP